MLQVLSHVLFEDNWVIQNEHWVNVIGLPDHLWSPLNAEVIEGVVGKGLVEVDRDCFGF